MWNEPWDEGLRWQACDFQSVMLIPCFSAQPCERWAHYMCDINANGPPVGPCLHHEAMAEEKKERWRGWGGGCGTEGGEVGGGKVWVTTESQEGGSGGAGKISGEKSKKTSQECKSLLRCKRSSQQKEGGWEETDAKAISSPQDNSLRTREEIIVRNMSVLTFFPSSKPSTTLWHFQEIWEEIEESIPSILLPCHRYSTVSSSGITKCLHIISVTQHEHFISFHIAVWKRRGGNAPIYTDRSICVK